jgi:hypothetical protein
MSKNNIDLKQNKGDSAVQNMAISRQAQEVQAAMVVAKRFPREEEQALNKILNACQRINLAEQATYEYPRGGTKVKGPSIRLAEALARHWGNIDYGIIELEQKKGESEMMAYAWDLENNTRATRVFTVKHVRDTRSGKKKLTSTRDIYEMTANMGARRVRACILEVIPGDITDEAIRQCETTIKADKSQPLEQRIENMIETFEDEYDVSEEQLEEKTGCKSKAFSENDVIKLGRIYQSLEDGMAGVEDFFGKQEDDTEESPFDKSDEDFADEVDQAMGEDDGDGT